MHVDDVIFLKNKFSKSGKGAKGFGEQSSKQERRPPPIFSTSTNQQLPQAEFWQAM